MPTPVHMFDINRQRSLWDAVFAATLSASLNIAGSVENAKDFEFMQRMLTRATTAADLAVEHVLTLP